MANIFYLAPVDGRASFYNKCRVSVDDNGAKTLYSYETAIAVIDANNAFKMLYFGENNDGKLTQTTKRHLKAFKAFYGID